MLILVMHNKMYIHIFSEFRRPEIFQRLESTVQIDVSKPFDNFVKMAEKEKLVIEKTAKLFYDPSIYPTDLINEIKRLGFSCMKPYTIVKVKQEHYKRVLKERIICKDLPNRIKDLINADLVYEDGAYSVYHQVLDSVEIIEEKHFIEDRIVFTLND